jgi:hypothetical protein
MPARAPSFAAARLRLAQPTSALSYAVAKLVRRSLLAKPDDVATISHSIVKEPRGYACAFSRRDPPESVHDHCPSKKQRAQGKPGARCTRSLACESDKAHEHSHHRFTGNTRPSLRNGFNGLFRALPGDRALLPPSLRGNRSAKLDASVGAPGPHGFAVRNGAARLASLSRPPHPASTSVTIAIRPSYRGGIAREVIADLG